MSSQLGVAERTCIGLGKVCRSVLRLQGETHEQLFERAREIGADFGESFRSPFDVRGKRVLEVGCGHGGMQVALLDAGARETVGIDLNPGFVEFALGRLRDQNAFVQVANAEQMPFAEESFDVVVSAAVFEHIHDIGEALREIERVLKPGGLLYATFSPTWWHYNGPHLMRTVGVPWAHVFFSDKTLLNVLRHYRAEGTFPAPYLDDKIEDFQQMGRLSLRKFRRAVKRTSLIPIQIEARSPRRWKDPLGRLPLLEEVIGGTATVVLRKPELRLRRRPA